MVASTVSRLSALLDSPISDEQAQRLGYETLLPLRESDGRRCSASIRLPVLHGSSACWRATQPALVHYRNSVAAPGSRCSSVRIWMG